MKRTLPIIIILCVLAPTSLTSISDEQGCAHRAHAAPLAMEKMFGSSPELLSGATPDQSHLYSGKLPSDESKRLTDYLRRVKGIPFLKNLEQSDITAVKENFLNYFSRRLPQLENWPRDYSKLSKNKAIAIRYSPPEENPFVPYLYRQDYFEPHVSFFGGAWGWESLEAARTEALKQCGDGCIVYLENDTPQITDAMIKDYFTARQNYVDKQRNALLLAEWLVLADRKNPTTNQRRSYNVLLSAKWPIKIGYPDWQQDYTSVCQDRVFDALLPVERSTEKQLLMRLKRLSSNGLYGYYHRTISTRSDFTSYNPKFKMERMSRFTRRYVFSSNPLSSHSLELPKNLSDALADEVIREIWVEGSVRVTNSGIPLVVDDNVSPLAIRTNKNFYEGLQIRMPDNGLNCYVSLPFSNNVLDLTGCGTNYSCAERALNVLLYSIKDELRKPPVLAEDIRNEPFGPGEFGMKRQFKPSFVLGAPYYELSTYMIETWVAGSSDPFGSLYGRQDFKGIDRKRVSSGEGKLVFLKVSHILTKSEHKNGTYSEPDRSQVEKFDGVLVDIINNAVRLACYQLGGKPDGSVCKLGPVR